MTKEYNEECKVCGNGLTKSQVQNRSLTCSKKCGGIYKRKKYVEENDLDLNMDDEYNVLLECKHCGSDFKVTPGQYMDGRGYCSYKCANDDKNGKIVSCCNCGKEIYKSKSELERYKRHCCSKKCELESRNGSKIVSCDNCNKKIKVYKSSIRDGMNRYCSKECRNESYKNGEYVECDYCGKEFYRTKWYKDNGYKHCSIECAGKARQLDRIYIECENCGKGIKVLESKLKYNPKYCSPECQQEARTLYPKTLHLRNAVRSRQSVKNLDDRYLKGYIKRLYSIEEVPQELIELKRLNIKRKRIIRNHNQKS